MATTIRKVPRSLSHYNLTTNGWTRTPTIAHIHSQTLTLVTWNLDYISPQPDLRAEETITQLFKRPKPADILFFQEVHPKARDSILDDPRIRNAFFATDAEDKDSFKGVKFTTMTLLSRNVFAPTPTSQKTFNEPEQQQDQPALVSRVWLPSAYRRDALSVDVPKFGTEDEFIRLVNVHLDSLPHCLPNRVRQMAVLTELLGQPGCAHAVVAGDFNAVLPEDKALLDRKSGLLDVWEELHGSSGPEGHTWGIGAQRKGGFKPGRLDKVVMKGLRARNIQVLSPDLILVSRTDGKSSKIPLSDHCGLECTFDI